jgi:acetyl/propionyl-CoA carboxylase alpha subunit
MRKIKSLLIANRGEIAIRIVKTARRMGIRTYCFQTPQEANAIYLNWADEIITVPATASAKPVFLDAEAIVAYAARYQIEAIHPGYGFLSENPLLPELCEKAGMLFIGPDAGNIRQMGDKNQARLLAQKAGLPVVRGTDHAVSSLDEATAEALKIGYPVILKALAGGGGKGMRVVQKPQELAMAWKMAVNEATNAFGNSAMIIEKYIQDPRHIEIQVLGDRHGQVVHLFERECSIQRNHQKLLEEAPCSALPSGLRDRISNDAVNLARHTSYATLGTVEFLLDDQGDYYFMEMNTRIQVEHPVTEAITGFDLVEWQIRTAAGEPLGFTQEDIKCKGAAIEFRINAENVQTGFTPNFGIIDEMSFPSFPGLRVDSGFAPGAVIPNCYDSLIAKIIVSGKDRADVIQKSFNIMARAEIEGVKTTVPFFKALLRDADFCRGKVTTSFVSRMERCYHQEENEEKAAAFIAMQAYLDDVQSIEEGEIGALPAGAWVSRMWNKLF